MASTGKRSPGRKPVFQLKGEEVRAFNIFEKYSVDLVLQGHNHKYCRSQYLKEVGKNCKNPPLYMVSITAANRNKGIQSTLQLFQSIYVDDKKITIDVYNAAGSIYDFIVILKGETNKVK